MPKPSSTHSQAEMVSTAARSEKKKDKSGSEKRGKRRSKSYELVSGVAHANNKEEKLAEVADDANVSVNIFSRNEQKNRNTNSKNDRKRMSEDICKVSTIKKPTIEAHSSVSSNPDTKARNTSKHQNKYHNSSHQRALEQCQILSASHCLLPQEFQKVKVEVKKSSRLTSYENAMHQNAVSSHLKSPSQIISAAKVRKGSKAVENFASRTGRHLPKSKNLRKSWPSRNLESVKGCTDLGASLGRRKFCARIINESTSNHRCFDFANGSTLKRCCLSLEMGFWVSENPRVKATREADIQRRSLDATKEVSDTRRPTSSTLKKPSEEELELPGFYFDAETKRYFRIVPSSVNGMSNVMTRERIAFERSERLRLEESRNLETLGRLADPRHQTSTEKLPNILTLIENLRMGAVSTKSAMHQVRKACVAKMGPSTRTQIQSLPGVKIKKILMNTEQNKLLLSCKDSTESQLDLMKIEAFSSGRKSVSKRSFDVTLEERLCHSRYSCIVDFCWTRDGTHQAAATRLGILYCTKSILPNGMNSTCLSYITQDDAASSELILNQTLDLPLCCAAGFHHFATGTECGAYLYSSTRPDEVIALKTSNAAVNAIAFLNMSFQVLFCAAKNRRILMFDQLSSTRKPVAYLAQQDSFSCDLYITNDDRYLLSAEFSGQRIQKWDLRQGRVVVEYSGHVNDYYKTPLVVDQQREFLSAVGTDSYTRIWDFNTSELMKILPPPLPATRDNIPSVCLSDLYAGSSNNHPQLLLAMSDELHFYF